MRITYASVAGTLALILAGAALIIAVTHTGPRGIQGPRGYQGVSGTAGKSAEIAHLGLCWNMDYVLNTQTGAAGMNEFANAITAPVDTDGVPSCPNGQFVSIVPGG